MIHEHADLSLMMDILDRPLGESWDKWWLVPEIRAAYREAVQAKVAELQEPECFNPHSFDGLRGIVTSGGGKYYPSLWVQLSRLRALGCTLPVEVWTLHEGEIDPHMAKLLEGFGDVTIRDASKQERKARVLNGWELKPYSLLLSSFQEALWLDADSVPTYNPEVWFLRLQGGPGAIFFADFPHWYNALLDAGAHEAVGLPPPPKESRVSGYDQEAFGKLLPPRLDVAWESGQFLVDKAKVWQELELALWLCEHSDYFFKLWHGDKEAFHFAWRLLGTPVEMPPRWPDWCNFTGTCLQLDFDDKIAFEHRNRPDSKWRVEDNNIRGNGKCPSEYACHQAVEALRRAWHGKPWINGNPDEAELALMRTVPGRYVYHRQGRDARVLELQGNGEIGEGRAANELHWSVFGERLSIVGREMTAGQLQATAVLNRCEGGWLGRWCINECPVVRLIPLGEAS